MRLNSDWYILYSLGISMWFLCLLTLQYSNVAMEHPQFFPGISNCHDDTGGYSHDITGHLEELGDPICRPTGVLGWQAHPIPWINSLNDFKKSYNNGSQWYHTWENNWEIPFVLWVCQVSCGFYQLNLGYQDISEQMTHDTDTFGWYPLSTKVNTKFV